MTRPTVVFLALGTNLGDRPANLEAAVAALPPAVKVIARSPIYETPPWGVTDQPAFLNMVLKGETDREPQALLDYLKSLEVELGRRPSIRFGPRLIDIDILFYGELVVKTEQLLIPHPHLQERAFVLVPLADLAADLVHPVLKKSIGELLKGVDTLGVRRVK